MAKPTGKIHRVNEDGSVPNDNPFVKRPGAIGSIWSYGHSNPQGLAIDPVTGRLWATEHGPRGVSDTTAGLVVRLAPVP